MITIWQFQRWQIQLETHSFRNKDLPNKVLGIILLHPKWLKKLKMKWVNKTIYFAQIRIRISIQAWRIKSTRTITTRVQRYPLNKCRQVYVICLKIKSKSQEHQFNSSPRQTKMKTSTDRIQRPLMLLCCLEVCKVEEYKSHWVSTITSQKIKIFHLHTINQKT